MPFTLQVDFSGLCVYVRDAVNQRVGILMPDARKRKANPTHVDTTKGAPHVGYLRYNLADLDPTFSQGSAREPAYEVVHLFDFEELDFGVPFEAGLDVTKINVPDVVDFAPDAQTPTQSRLELIDDLFTGAPPLELLLRARLSGGTLIGLQAETWRFPDLWTPGQPFEGVFAPIVTWKRTINAANITLQLKTLGGTLLQAITLRPANGSTILLKVANFCEINPMEWLDLGTRQVDHDDVDFKWLYRLLQPVTGTYGSHLGGKHLPVPQRPSGGPTGVEDCLGLQISGTVPL